jgi:hypothetical protein
MLRSLVLYTLCCALAASAQVTIQKGSDKVTVDINGKPFTEFYVSGEGVRKPYLHPLRAATGKIVTRQFPMVTGVPGESKDHPHHRGLSFTHGDVNGIDFWMSDPLARNDNGAKIALKQVREAKGGKKQGRIVADFEWTDKQGNVLLTEARTMTFHADTDKRVVDIDIQLKAVKDAKFGDTKEGSFGIRLADGLTEKSGGGKMRNAEGLVGEKAVWGKPSPWVDYAGTLDGESVGIAILDHPANPRHPTHWHSRSYGLFAANVFGLHDFYNDKSKDGSMSLKAGDTVRWRYRVIIHAGDADAANIGKEFATFSKMK